MSRPDRDIEGAVAAHRRLLADLGQVDPTRPSQLPGWTVGHVLTHLARNADAFVRLLVAASAGRSDTMYPGGRAQRDADIEAGAGRAIGAIVEDLSAACTRLEAAWDGVDDRVWATGQGEGSTGTLAIAEVPHRRRREVEVHHVDLGLAYGSGDWPEDYARRELPLLVQTVPDRLLAGTVLRVISTDSGDEWVLPGGEPTAVARSDCRTLVAWLLGRLEGGRTGTGSQLPSLGPWQVEQRSGPLRQGQ